jgi:hypothetical protein
MSFRLVRRSWVTLPAAVVGIGFLQATQIPAGLADEVSRAAKSAELAQLQGLAGMMRQSNAAQHEAATQLAQSIADKTFAPFPAVPQDKRVAVESASQQFLHEVDSSSDQDDAAQAWGRFYSDGLTEKELDTILAYYRSAIGQKDVRASQAALPQFEKYMAAKRAAVMSAAVTKYTAALQEIANPAKDASIQSETLPVRHGGSNPWAPDGKVIADSMSDRCEVPPSAALRAHDVPPSGRSVLCVCIDAKGKLTQEPLITESSGDSKVDSGAVKLARSGSGRYKPSIVGGQPQKGCFRFAINFRHQE